MASETAEVILELGLADLDMEADLEVATDNSLVLEPLRLWRP
jgi:hypothetical protein